MPRKQNLEDKTRETPPPRQVPGFDDLALPMFAVWPVKGGFKLKAGPGLRAEDLPLSLSVTTAYEIRSGNPFKKYDARDYRLEDAPIQVTYAGVTEVRASGQLLDFIATSVDFNLEVAGFDVRRDLKVKVEERSDTE